MYHTLAPCAALLPIFFSTPYRSHARNFITNSNFCTPFSLLDSYLNPLSDWPPIARYIFNRWPFARRSKWQISLFWPFCAYPTRVRARKKHSSTGFSLLCDIPFDAELDALLTLKICRVLDLYEKFHRENIGRNDVENRRFSAFFYTLTQNSATGGHLGPVMFIVTTSGAQRLSIRIEMGAWNPHPGICQSFICEKSHICGKKFGGTLGKLAVVSLQIRISARCFHR